jgi:hypothetical protein
MVVFGEEELQRKIVQVKNMKTKTELEVAFDVDAADCPLIDYLLAQGCKTFARS